MLCKTLPRIWIAASLAAAIPFLTSACAKTEVPDETAQASDQGNTQGETSNAPEVATPTGLKYQELKVGDGAEAVSGKTVQVHYVGTLENGTQFDSSLDRGEPFAFRLGAGEVIEGWEQGIAGMKVGGKRKLIIPAELGYGQQGAGEIPPGATLIFEVQLLGVQD